MSDPELLKRLADFMREPRTMRAICAEFHITRPSAVFWVALIAGDKSYRIETGDTREGAAGPRSKTWKAVRVEP